MEVGLLTGDFRALSLLGRRRPMGFRIELLVGYSGRAVADSHRIPCYSAPESRCRHLNQLQVYEFIEGRQSDRYLIPGSLILRERNERTRPTSSALRPALPGAYRRLQQIGSFVCSFHAVIAGNKFSCTESRVSPLGNQAEFFEKHCLFPRFRSSWRPLLAAVCCRQKVFPEYVLISIDAPKPSS